MKKNRLIKALKKAKALRSDQTFWKLRVKKIGGRK